MNDAECVEFMQWALPQLRMRWPGFRKVRTQVRKRLQKRIAELGLDGEAEYRFHLAAHPSEWNKLDSLCRITISRFYRDRAIFDFLGQTLLPRLAGRRRGALTCWSVGCCSGEEAYTLQLLWKLSPRPGAATDPLYVLGTDAIRELPPQLKTGAFDELDGGFRLRDQLRGDIAFERRDIRDGMPPGPFDLILCRNFVFTYYEEGLQAELLAQILDRLTGEGFLVIGGHESLPDGDFPLQCETQGVYRKA
jgi:chemotaxis protein methyltransferase CheR